jgi:hypothetical protein
MKRKKEENKQAYLSSNRMNISRSAFDSWKCTAPRPTHKVTLEESIILVVTWMARALLGNGPVNTPRPNTHKATMEDVYQWRNVIARC